MKINRWGRAHPGPALRGGIVADLPTVTIKADTALGYMIINQDDFNPDRHQPYGKTGFSRGLGEAKVPDLERLSNKDLAAWGREALGLEKLDGRMSRASIMKSINAGIAEQRDG